MLELDKVKNILSQLKPDLEARYPIGSIGLFGSIVRDDFNDQSDIDIIIEFTGPIGIEFIDIANELEMKLERKVDLVSRGGIKEKYYQYIQPEIIYV